MMNPASAVLLEVGTNRRYTKNTQGLIYLRVTNTDPTSSVIAQIELRGDLVDAWTDPPRMLAPAGDKVLKIPLLPESKGDFLFHAHVILELNDGSVTRYTGEFDLTVEAENTEPNNINVSIINEVKGTGFIDASDLKIPSIMTHDAPVSNQLKYEEIALERDLLTDALSNCILEDTTSKLRIHVLTGDRITFGRNAEMADVSVPFPNESISRIHCCFERANDYFILENLSTTRPPQLNSTEVRSQTRLPVSEDSDLKLSKQASFHIHPIPTSEIDQLALHHLTKHGFRYDRGPVANDKLAAILITQNNQDSGSDELYLWLFQTIRLEDIPGVPLLNQHLALTQIPKLIALDISDSGTIRSLIPVTQNKHIGQFLARP